MARIERLQSKTVEELRRCRDFLIVKMFVRDLDAVDQDVRNPSRGGGAASPTENGHPSHVL
jgi:hypothetical protein